MELLVLEFNVKFYSEINWPLVIVPPLSGSPKC
jgi:hypothetical protein